MDHAYVPGAEKDDERANQFAKKGLAYLKPLWTAILCAVLYVQWSVN